MIRGDRIRERLAALGRSQGWLAREVDLTPQAISKMVNGATEDTPKLHQMARALETTPEYLTGETDDIRPESAPGRLPIQFVTFSVALPNEDALADMLESLLALVPADATRAEAARILAQRLPAGFAGIGPVAPDGGMVTMNSPAKPVRSPATGRPARR